MRPQALILCGFLCLLGIALTACQAAQESIATIELLPTSAPVMILGTVVDEAGKPVTGATVKIQGTNNETLTDEQGRYRLGGLQTGQAVTVSAWSEGYYCAKVEAVMPPAMEVRLMLRRYQTVDNSDYLWMPPTGENSCYSCKPGVTQVWLDNDAHGRSAVNPRYLSMYNGTDLSGNQSPLTRYVLSKEYGSAPLKPDKSQPYYGPGYKLDFPDEAGNCAACHNPGAAIEAPYATDPNTVSGVDQSGIHCDYCHKIAAVTLDPQSGLPYTNRPGVLSQDIRRPFPEDKERYQLFFGSFKDDNVPQEDTYLALIQQSQFCAPCHYGVFWDTTIYNSYGEWLESPYSDAGSGRTCQQCHMPAPTLLDGETMTNVAPGKGGIERDPLTIAAHTFPGASSVELLQNAVSLSAQAVRQDGRIMVRVTIVNDQTGHHVPTDSPLRQVILLVDARAADGTLLPFLDGPVVPDWGGVGDPTEGYYAGQPGKAFAKILMEQWTQVAPSAAYWNQTVILSDNRLPALGSDASSYAFAVPEGGEATITVRLIYRRAFIELMQQKGWDAPDILMEIQTIQI